MNSTPQTTAAKMQPTIAEDIAFLRRYSADKGNLLPLDNLIAAHSSSQRKIEALEKSLRRVVKEASGYAAIGFDHDDESAELQAALDEAVVILEDKP